MMHTSPSAEATNNSYPHTNRHIHRWHCPPLSTLPKKVFFRQSWPSLVSRKQSFSCSPYPTAIMFLTGASAWKVVLQDLNRLMVWMRPLLDTPSMFWPYFIGQIDRDISSSWNLQRDFQTNRLEREYCFTRPEKSQLQRKSSATSRQVMGMKWLVYWRKGSFLPHLTRTKPLQYPTAKWSWSRQQRSEMNFSPSSSTRYRYSTGTLILTMISLLGLKKDNSGCGSVYLQSFRHSNNFYLLMISILPSPPAIHIFSSLSITIFAMQQPYSMFSLTVSPVVLSRTKTCPLSVPHRIRASSMGQMVLIPLQVLNTIWSLIFLDFYV